MPKRRAWTARERILVRTFAKEGLSIARTADALKNLYGIDVKRGPLSAFASREKIKFKARRGPPFGNTNRTGARGLSEQERKRINRERMQKIRRGTA